MMEASTSLEATISNSNGTTMQNGDISLKNNHPEIELIKESEDDSNESIKEPEDHSNLLTDKMLAEERKLEEKAMLEEEAREKKMLEKSKKMAEEQRKAEEEKCFKRLHLLLSRSSIYSKFMVEKLQTHEMKEKKKGKLKSTEDSLNSHSDDSTTNRGRKRKAEDSPSKKHLKAEVNILDVFKKNDMKNMQFDDSPKEEVTSKNNILESQPDLLYGGIMRPYQLEGFDWLKTLFENGVNGILADEMGLGKTIQCIAFIAYLVEMGVSGPFFICGPLSTVPNWYAEFQRFTPDIPVMIYHGDKAERPELLKKIRKKVQIRDMYCYPVVITSYQIALNDVSKLKHIHWKMLVIDEAHRIKNFQCKLVQALKSFNAVHRLLLTGTPLQNDLSELWSLLNFILPEIFNDLQVFQSWFDVNRLTKKSGTMEIIAREQEKQIVSTIHQILNPFLLRRTKSDVELSLPPKKEVIVHAPLTKVQQQYYTSTLNHAIRGLLNVDTQSSQIIDLPKRVGKQTAFFGCESNELCIDLEKASQMKPSKSFILDMNVPNSEIHLKLGTYQMCLRKICCHPYLISYPLNDYDEYLIDENLVKSSGKLLVLDCLLPKLIERGHKMLLFSQFVTMLEILQDYCGFRNYKYCRLTGDMSLPERQKQIEEFNEDKSVVIFLISTKAGGLGINLTAADTVIIYDSDWNPQGDLQAQDRCHRIGQSKPVVVYRLIVPGTIDERVTDIATAKRKLEKVIIKKGRFASKDNILQVQPKITEEELLELLESKDFHGFVKTDSNHVISPEELNKILDRSDMVAKEE